MPNTYIDAKFTEQMPFVGTKQQRRMVELEAQRDRVSRATVVRRALDAYFRGRWAESEVEGEEFDELNAS